MKTARDFSGIITALVTPFKDGGIDWASFESLLEFQIGQDIDGFVVNGTTGESPTLTESEVKQLVAVTKKRIENSGRNRALIVGTGSNSTAKTIEMTKKAEDWGAEAGLVVTPYYNKPPQRGLYQHFKAVADAVKIPILLYNVPGRTITSIDVSTMSELAQVSNIIGVKEATGDLEFGEKVLKSLPQDFLVTSGDDGTCMKLAQLGGAGTISVCSHIIGDKMREVLGRVKSGDNSAQSDYDKYQKFIAQLYTEANPIAVKMALYLKGVIKSPELRLPLVQLDEKYMVSLKTSMQEIGLLHV